MYDGYAQQHPSAGVPSDGRHEVRTGIVSYYVLRTYQYHTAVELQQLLRTINSCFIISKTMEQHQQQGRPSTGAGIDHFDLLYDAPSTSHLNWESYAYGVVTADWTAVTATRPAVGSGE